MSIEEKKALSWWGLLTNKQKSEYAKGYLNKLSIEINTKETVFIYKRETDTYYKFIQTFDNNKTLKLCKTCMFSDCSVQSCLEEYECDVANKALEKFNNKQNEKRS